MIEPTGCGHNCRWAKGSIWTQTIPKYLRTSVARGCLNIKVNMRGCFAISREFITETDHSPSCFWAYSLVGQTDPLTKEGHQQVRP